MAQVVQFDGLGTIEFPDDASQEQILANLKEHKAEYRKGLIGAQMEEATSEPTEERSTLDKADNAFAGSVLSSTSQAIKALGSTFEPVALGSEPKTELERYQAWQRAGMATKYFEHINSTNNTGFASDPAKVRQAWESMRVETRATREAGRAATAGITDPLDEKAAEVSLVEKNIPGNETVANLAGAAGSIVPILPLSGSGTLGVAGSALQSAGSTKEDAMAFYSKWMPADDAERLSDEDAAMSGNITGLVTAGMEHVPGMAEAAAKLLPKSVASKVQKFGAVFGDGGVETILRRAGMSQAGVVSMKTAAKKIMAETVGEATEEGTDQLLQGAYAMHRYRPELTWDQALQEAAQAAVAGGLLGGGTEGLRIGIHNATQKKAPTSKAVEVAKAGAPGTAAALDEALKAADVEKPIVTAELVITKEGEAPEARTTEDLGTQLSKHLTEKYSRKTKGLIEDVADTNDERQSLLTDEEKAALQAEVADLQDEDASAPTEEPMVVDVETLLNEKPSPEPATAPEATAKQEPAIVSEVHKVVEDLRATYGDVVKTVDTSHTSEGSGIASAPRAGDFSTLHIDPVKLQEAVNAGMPLKSAVGEEIGHMLQGQALHTEWKEAGEPGTWQQFWDDKHKSIAEEMTPAQKEQVQRAYGSELKSPVQMAAEYIRMLLQEKYQGKITEADYDRAHQPAMTRMLETLRGFWNKLISKSQIGPLAQSYVARIDSLLSKPSKTNDSKTVHDDAGRSEASSAQPQGAEVHADNQRPQAATGEQGRSRSVHERAGGGRGQLQEAFKHDELTVPHDWFAKAHSRINQLTESKLGKNSVAALDAEDYIWSRLGNAAESWFREHGTMDGFSLNKFFNDKLANFYEYNGAKKRHAEGGDVSLNKSIGEDGDATVADTISDESQLNDISESDSAKVIQAAFGKLPKPSRDLLAKLSSGKSLSEIAKDEGVSPAALTSRRQTIMRQLTRMAINDPALREVLIDKGMIQDTEEDFLNAAPPIDPMSQTEGNLDDKARDLSFMQKTLRFAAQYRWGGVGYLQDIADRTPNPRAAAAIRYLADRVGVYYDRWGALAGRLSKPIADFRNTHTKEQTQRVFAEVESWVATAQARDGGLTQQQSFANAQAMLPQLSQDARNLIDHIQRQGLEKGRINAALDVYVKDGRRWRAIRDLGRMYWPRVLAQGINEILSDPDNPANKPRYVALLQQLVAHDPQTFPNIRAADEYLSQSVIPTLKSGDHYSGAELARGNKLPDAWYDYTIEGALMPANEQYAKRMAQIAAFGQSRPGNLDTFEEVQRISTRQPELSKRIGQIADQVLDRGIEEWGDKMRKVTVSIAVVRYLTAFMTMTRNVMSALNNTNENLGTVNTVKAGLVGIRDAFSAAYRSAASPMNGGAKLYEPSIVSSAMDAGSVQRAMTQSLIWGMSNEDSTWKRVVNVATMPNQLAEMWGRSVNDMAAQLYLRDFVKEHRINPTSDKVLRMKGLMYRWGLTAADVNGIVNGDVQPANKFRRRAVREKQYGYAPDQTPLMFRNKSIGFMLQFQAYGAQRARDIARNIMVPLIIGDHVDGQVVRDPMPLVRFLMGILGMGLLAEMLREKLFGRADKMKAPIAEIQNTWSDDEWKAFGLGVSKFLNYVTLTGSAGILPDHLRGWYDDLSQGRHKEVGVMPGTQIFSDLTELIQRRTERGGWFSTEGLYRDLRDIFVYKTPAIREARDFGLTWIFDKTDPGLLKAAQEDLGVARSAMKRWAEESGFDARMRKPNATGFAKNSSSEVKDELYEALLVGDTEEAGRLVNEFTKDRSDRKKMMAIKASVRARTPLSGTTGMRPEDMREFMDWLEKRNPAAFEATGSVLSRYDRTARAVGIR